MSLFRNIWMLHPSASPQWRVYFLLRHLIPHLWLCASETSCKYFTHLSAMKHIPRRIMRLILPGHIKKKQTNTTMWSQPEPFLKDNKMPSKFKHSSPKPASLCSLTMKKWGWRHSKWCPKSLHRWVTELKPESRCSAS